MNTDIKKESEKPVKLFTLDVETRGLYGNIFRVGFYDGGKYHATNTFKQLKSILTHYTTKYDCHIFIHNLDFDLSKMAHDLVQESDLKNSIFINNNVTVFKSNITTMQNSEENEIVSYPITFHDSNKLIPGRLKKICKDFKIEERKAKIELKEHILSLGWGRDDDDNPTDDPKKYNEFNSEGYYFENVDPYETQLNEYLRNDCVSLYEVVVMLHKLSGLPIREFLKCPTTASLAMKVYQVEHPDDYEKATSTNYLGQWGSFKEEFIRKGYYGGRTEVFQPILQGGYHYDVNSLYPYVMKENEIPYGMCKHYKGNKARDIFKYWYNYQAGGGFIEVDIYIPEDIHIPPLPAKRDLKLMFPVGRLRGVWTFEEIELALEMGCKIENIYQCIYFERKGFIFKDFVSYFEEIKNTSDGAKRQFAKLMQNSLYGKFGMQRMRMTLLPVEEVERCKKKGYRYVPYYNDLLGGEFIEAEIPSFAPYIQPHIAAYVTSLARILLYRGLINQLEKGEVAYCDTDSIACSATFPDEMVHDKEYGKWALEGELETGIFIQPKTYYEKYKNGEEEKKFKGIPKKYIKSLTRETYEDIISKLQEVQRKQEAGEKIEKEEAYYSIYKGEKKRVKFATTLKSGETNFDLHTEINKGILLTNQQKRKMDYINNSSKPHVIYDY